MRYTITQLGNVNEWVISNASSQFVGQYASLALALAYLAGILQYGDSITYIDEPLKT
jgi:hypothetical protein